MYLNHILFELGTDSRINYGYVLNDFCKLFGRKLVVNVTMLNVEQFLYSSNRPTNNYYNFKLSVLRSFFNWCIVHEHVVKNPTLKIKIKKIARRVSKRVLSESEVKLILRRLEGDSYVAVLVMFRLGLRLSECAGLRRSHFKLLKVGDDRRWVVVIEGKGDVVRRLMPPKEVVSECFRAMDRYKHLKNPPVFLGRDAGESIAPRTLYKRIVNDLKKNGLPAVTPHWFRHSFASNLMASGADVNKVRTSLGHTDLSTTQRYLDELRVVDLSD